MSTCTAKACEHFIPSAMTLILEYPMTLSGIAIVSAEPNITEPVCAFKRLSSIVIDVLSTMDLILPNSELPNVLFLMKMKSPTLNPSVEPVVIRPVPELTVPSTLVDFAVPGPVRRTRQELEPRSRR